MAQSRRGKKGGNYKQIFRKHMRRNKGYLPVFYGNVGMDSSSVARSLRTFMQGGIGSSGRKSAYGDYIPRKGTRKRQIYDEWKKVRKRMDELIAEGYDFDTDEFRDIYSDWQSMKNSKKQLERLKKLTKAQLRREATAYQGITDKLAMWKKWKNRKKEALQKIIDEQVEAQRKADQEILDRHKELDRQKEYDDKVLEKIASDLDVKIQNIMEDEMAYLAEIDEWYSSGRVKSEKYINAKLAAEAVIRLLPTLNDEDKEVIVQEYETNDKLSGVINSAENRYRGLFYEEFAPGFNKSLAALYPGIQEMVDEVDDEEFMDFSNIKPTSWGEFDEDDLLPL